MPKGRIVLLSCVLWLSAWRAAAAAEPVPILLRFPDNAELAGPKQGEVGSGLIADWSFSSLNKQQAAVIFHSTSVQPWSRWIRMQPSIKRMSGS